MWLLNEGSGDIISDLSGNPFNSTSTFGTPAWIAGKTGPALDFDGATDGIKLATLTSGMYGSSPRTIIMRMKFDSFPAIFDQSALQCSGNAGGAGAFWDIGPEAIAAGGNGIGIAFNGHRVIWDKAGGVSLSTGVWYDFASVVPDGAANTADVIAYIDGVLANANTEAGSSQALNTNTGDWTIGSSITGLGNFFNGQVEFLYAYDRALSATEIDLLRVNPYIMFDRDEIWSPATQGSIVIFRRRIEAA
jgi:hypothetical protein